MHSAYHYVLMTQREDVKHKLHNYLAFSRIFVQNNNCFWLFFVKHQFRDFKLDILTFDGLSVVVSGEYHFVFTVSKN